MDARLLSHARLLLRAVAVALLVLAVLRPPETYAWSRAACAMILGPAGPFTLPAALAGFFALTLPLTLLEARLLAGRRARALLVVALLLQSYALFLTRSVGGLAATGVSLSLSLPIVAPRSTRTLLAA